MDLQYESRSVQCPRTANNGRRPCRGKVIKGQTLCAFHKRQELWGQIFATGRYNVGETDKKLKEAWQEFKEAQE